MDYIGALESALGVTAKKNFLPMQPGDVPQHRQIQVNLGNGSGSSLIHKLPLAFKNLLNGI